MSTPDERLTMIETTLWGRFGTNGVNSEVKRHSEQIGDLYGRDETLRTDLDTRMAASEQRINDKLDGLYKLVATVIVTIILGAGSIVATILVSGGS